MEVNEILRILEEMNVAVIATADENNQPHARHIHIGVANEKGVFFMTSPKTNFYKQLQNNQKSCHYCYEERGLLNPSNSYRRCCKRNWS